ncbi:nitrile hydratase accessory protein [Aquabacterium sp. OR-4]|uniref:nitrile hydratase accessory protein n=1 Tax=Aquabacterium sp. OR-4 TaxID=2978127 RepID=UPI0021B467D6|nr:nitrile hydratase accessory protein [Aquabacterium sp. OR-4]MDT7837146.1 nitrile hydratase accessory protein [Aquabacterium sp. OR-4]
MTLPAQPEGQGHGAAAEASARPPVDLGLCPGLPLGGGRADAAAAEPVFAEPWQAQAFAMTLQLHRQGLFSWPEWAAALAAEIRRAQAAGDADLGHTYYHHWLAALEGLVSAKGATDAATLARHAQAWGHAAERTPHGQPITLQPGDFQRG